MNSCTDFGGVDDHSTWLGTIAGVDTHTRHSLDGKAIAVHGAVHND